MGETLEAKLRPGRTKFIIRSKATNACYSKYSFSLESQCVQVRIRRSLSQCLRLRPGLKTLHEENRWRSKRNPI